MQTPAAQPAPHRKVASETSRSQRQSGNNRLWPFTEQPLHAVTPDRGINGAQSHRPLANRVSKSGFTRLLFAISRKVQVQRVQLTMATSKAYIPVRYFKKMMNGQASQAGYPSRRITPQ
jgi:hypothetical protein